MAASSATLSAPDAASGAGSAAAGGTRFVTAGAMLYDTSMAVGTCSPQWRGFSAFYGDEQHADARLRSVDGVEFPCHRIVLAARCPAMGAMFRSSMQEATQRVISLGISQGAMTLMLRFLYTSTIPAPSQSSLVAELCKVADMYQLPRLKLLAELGFCKAMVPEQVPEAFIMAQANGLAILQALCFRACRTRIVASVLQQAISGVGSGGQDSTIQHAASSPPQARQDAVAALLHAALRAKPNAILQRLEEHCASLNAQERAAAVPMAPMVHGGTITHAPGAVPCGSASSRGAASPAMPVVSRG